MRVFLISWRLLSKNEQFAFLGFLAARIFLQAVEIAVIALLGVLIGGLANPESGSLEYQLPFTSLTFDLVTLGVIIFSGYLVKSVFGILLLRSASFFWARVAALKSADLLAFALSHPAENSEYGSKGGLDFAVSTSAGIAFNSIILAFMNLAVEIIFLFAIVGIFFATDALIASVAIAVVLLLALVYQTLIARRTTLIGDQIKTQAEDLTDILVDSATGSKEYLAAGSLGYFTDRFRNLRVSFGLNQARQRVLLGLPRLILEPSVFLLFLLLLLQAAKDGDFSSDLGSLSIFLVGGLRLMSGLSPIQNALTEFRINGRLAEPAQRKFRRLLDFSGSARGTRQLANPWPASVVADGMSGARVSLNEVAFRLTGAKTSLLDGISLEVQPGDVFGIAGPSGSGKTTLAEIMLGLHTPSAGQVLIDDMPAATFRRNFPAGIAYVTQRPALFKGTLLENLVFSKDGSLARSPHLERALHEAQLDPLIRRLPKGLDTEIKATENSFSGGEIQRIGLARALFNRPKLIVLDEFTSAADPSTEEQLLSLLSLRRAETTIIVIAHRLPTLLACGKVGFLENGKLIKTVGPESISENYQKLARKGFSLL